jgi:osmotically-inducible protein OsmY
MIFINKRLATVGFALALAALLGCTSQAAKQGNREANEDSVITGKVSKAISGEATLKSSQITVETSKGVVLLSGYVNSAAEENTATELARYVKGVTLVRDAIRIK